MDPLRDDALVYAHLLRQAGTKTKVDVYKGIPHGGPDFFPMLGAAQRAMEDLRAGAGWVLDGGKGRGVRRG